ncbi:MAG: exo-alpha-sialidase, partial [Flavobacteriales bacterium]|nr:exo-alpha-sialidase [Flavobacteriales bacterium]
MRTLSTLHLLAGSLFFAVPGSAQWVLRGLHQVHNDGNLTGHDGVLFGSSELNGMTRSYDAGATWQALPNGPEEARACIHDGTYLLAGTSTGIVRSSDDGDTWESANGTIPASGTNWVFRFRLVNDVLFAIMSGNMNSGGGIYRSADHGTTWTSCNTGLSGSFSRVRDVVSMNGDLYCGLALNVYRSTDMGSTWSAMNDEG